MNLVDALKESDSESLKEKMVKLMNTYISARKMGEAEAFFKIFPDFLLKVGEKQTYNGQRRN